MQEAHTKVIELPEDDSEALEVVLKYLYTLSPDCLVIDEYPVQHCNISEGYLVLLVEIFRPTEKFFLDVLAEHVLNYMTHPMICVGCQAEEAEYQAEKADYEPEKLEHAYIEHCLDPCALKLTESPREVIKAIVACDAIGSSDFAIQLRAYLYEQAASSEVWVAYNHAKLEGEESGLLTNIDKKSLASIDADLLPYPHIKNKIMARMYLNWDGKERKCTKLTKELKLERDKIARYERHGAYLSKAGCYIESPHSATVYIDSRTGHRTNRDRPTI